ncbi:2529_t:CDS:2, partial [Acaulospora morrowiae]
ERLKNKLLLDDLQIPCDTDDQDKKQELIIKKLEAERQCARRQTQTPEEAILERALSFTNSFPDEINVGKMDVICDACGALHFAGERTDELKALFEKSHPLSSKFFKLIRNYNAAMAFASILSNIDNQTDQGPYIYRISSQIYHFVGPVKPASNEKPSFGQLYFLDTAEAREQRAHHPTNICLNHQRRYNTPQANEVAAVVVGFNDEQFLPHQLVIRPHASSLQIIPVINANCDPMSYPLLFPA